MRDATQLPQWWYWLCYNFEYLLISVLGLMEYYRQYNNNLIGLFVLQFVWWRFDSKYEYNSKHNPMPYYSAYLVFIG